MKAGPLAPLENTDLRRVKKLGILAVGTLTSVLIIPATAGVRLNYSPSLPVGLYIVTSDPSAELVEFCPAEPYASTAAERGYRSVGSCPDGGAPLMKPIVARPGDRVEIGERGVAVNGKLLANSAALSVDTTGRRLAHWPFGRYTVNVGTAWVISSYSRRSFDSRYFGPIGTDRIHHQPTRTSNALIRLPICDDDPLSWLW
jgi:conjugative transfer signal peptidase TraF